MTQQQYEQAGKLTDQIRDHEWCIGDLADLREGFAKGESVSFASDKLYRAVENLTKDEALTVLAMMESLHEDHKRRLEHQFADL